MRVPFLGCLGTCLLSLFWVQISQAAEAPAPPSPWQITADKISRFVNPPSVIAEGNVVLVRQGLGSMGQITKLDTPEPASKLKPLTITGDWIRLDPVSNQVKVRGHAVLDSEEEHITADLVDLDTEKQVGHLQHATIYFPKRSLYLAGEQVEKTGDLTYHLENGWVTKCDPVKGQAPPWSFGWGRADISQEGFAHFTHATFRVRDVPVVYSPYVAFPTNTKRKTGVLLPELSAGSRDGAGVLVPLFVNISPSVDLTLYGGGLAERGPVLGSEFRYVRDEASKGIVQLNLLNDSLADDASGDFKSDGIYRTETDRYWLRGKVDHDFGNQLNGKIDVDVVSDQDYLEEYSSGLLGYTASADMFAKEFGRGFEAKTTRTRSNSGQLTKLWQTMTMGGEVRTINDPSAVSAFDHPWSLPSLTFSGGRPLMARSASRPGLNALAAATDLTWDSSYVYYWREEGLGGQRLDLHPILKAPLPFGPYLETSVAVGMRQTMVQLNERGTVTGYDESVQSRTLSEGMLATSTIFMRDFDMGGDWVRHLTHMVRPGLDYTYAPVPDPVDTPFLDRVEDRNLVTYGISNDFEVEGASGSAWKLGYARLSQAYDINEARRDLEVNERRRVWTDVVFESWVQPIQNLKFLYETTIDIYGEDGNNHRTGASYATARGDVFVVEHRYDSARLINQLNIDFAVHLTRTLQTQAIINHSLDTDETSDTSLRLLYTPSCWGLALQATTTPDDDYRITLLFSLEGVGNVLGLSQDLSSSSGLGGVTP